MAKGFFRAAETILRILNTGLVPKGRAIIRDLQDLME
jgi:hypothetical protein